MRDIKFRAWHEGKMISDVQFTYPHIKEGHELSFGYFLAEECPIMQYTGLKDKNGKEIYEGDVLKWSARDIDNTIMRENYSVGFDNGSFTITEVKTGITETFEDYDKKHFTIIGNIYENKELLHD